ncbi:MAG: DUF502 domain-containing protein [Fibrobacterota bacterium]
MIRKLRDNFFAGLIIIVPILATAFLIYKAFVIIDSPVNGLIRQFFKVDLPVGIGLVILVVGCVLVGVLARKKFARLPIKMGQSFLERIPFVHKVYKNIRQISEAFIGGGKKVFKKAVLIEYPRKGLYSIAFLTSDTSSHITRRLRPVEPNPGMCNVFLPTTPNPTSGFMLIVPKEDVKDLGLGIEEAVRIIMSGGMVYQEKLPGVEEGEEKAENK